MRRFAQAVLIFAVGAALVLGWGYWHASRHAHLDLKVDDHGLRSSSQAYGTPHDVALAFRDGADRLLAEARSVEPQGYILAIHPDATIGNCQHRSIQPDYSACYSLYSAWSASWAPQVRRADVRVGSCALRGVPVAVYQSNSEWPVWWVPLPHVGGSPYRYVALSVAIDSSSCAAATPSAERAR